jgi:hypothetical protein
VTKHTRNVYTSNKKSDNAAAPAGDQTLVGLVFQGDSHQRLRGFPSGVKHDLGYAL